MTLRRPLNAPPLYSQDGKGYEAIVYGHYFVQGNDWLVTEYDPDQDIAFGWVCLNGDRQNAELGYFSFVEMESVRVPLRLRLPSGNVATIGEQVVEREIQWERMPLREAIALLDGRHGKSE